MNVENVRLTAVAAVLVLTFAAVFVSAALQSAWLLVGAVVGGPITAVTIGLAGLPTDNRNGY